MSSVLWFTKSIDFGHHIGHAVAFVCLAAYGVIFYFIWLDGEYGREMKRKEKVYKKKQQEKLLKERDSHENGGNLKKSPVKTSKLKAKKKDD